MHNGQSGARRGAEGIEGSGNDQAAIGERQKGGDIPDVGGAGNDHLVVDDGGIDLKRARELEAGVDLAGRRRASNARAAGAAVVGKTAGDVDGAFRGGHEHVRIGIGAGDGDEIGVEGAWGLGVGGERRSGAGGGEAEKSGKPVRVHLLEIRCVSSGLVQERDGQLRDLT